MDSLIHTPTVGQKASSRPRVHVFGVAGEPGTGRNAPPEGPGMTLTTARFQTSASLGL